MSQDNDDIHSVLGSGYSYEPNMSTPVARTNMAERDDDDDNYDTAVAVGVTMPEEARDILDEEARYKQQAMEDSQRMIEAAMAAMNRRQSVQQDAQDEEQ